VSTGALAGRGGEGEGVDAQKLPASACLIGHPPPCYPRLHAQQLGGLRAHHVGTVRARYRTTAPPPPPPRPLHPPARCRPKIVADALAFDVPVMNVDSDVVFLRRVDPLLTDGCSATAAFSCTCELG
jgi:hypothetical protein